jgi:tRNA A-37 threonylcarbamoyl transferase component Bud32
MIAERYRVLAELGSGGIGVILRVVDTLSGQERALKRLRTDALTNARQAANNASAFEREYCTLAQLAHPRVVAVHDYGVDKAGPYYTMDLLGGRDLRERAPLPWRHVCSLLRDISSCLALLHSRHLLHRDLSPNNVRCSDDGHATLLDFGALAQFGRNRQIIGTPSFMAPESLYGQELDARTDLFSLGALGYFALTGRAAYRAQTLAALAEAWSSPPEALREQIEGVPAELEALIMSLLSLDPMARPTSASEVVSRLAVIADLPDDVQLDRAYLTAPAWVGRAGELDSFKRELVKALRDGNAAVIVEGPAGAGRTRFLSAASLEAKLAGALVLQASAAELDSEPFAVLRALAADLFAQRPELARQTFALHMPTLQAVLPEWCPTPAPDAQRTAAEIGAAFSAWFDAIREQSALAIFVDDFDHCDARSAEVLANLTTDTARRRLLVTLALLRAEGSAKVASMAQPGVSISLPPLTLDETLVMLRSLFGPVAHLDMAAGWIQRLAQGNPRANVALAQHLVSRKIARLMHGRWVLPDSLRDLDLPDSLEAAAAARFSALQPAAQHVALALSLVRPTGALGLAELVTLASGPLEPEGVYAALTELVGAQVITPVADSYAFNDDMLQRRLAAAEDSPQARALHRKLAHIYLERADNEIRALAAFHWLRGGAPNEAYAIMRDTAEPTQISGVRILFGKSRDGIELHRAMLQYAEANDAPPAELQRCRKVVIELAATCDPQLADAQCASAALARLRIDTGLVFLDDTNPALELSTRTQQCLQRALRVWEQSSVHARGLHPITALQELGTIGAALSAAYVRSWDGAGLLALRPMLEPFTWIPGIALVHGLLEMVIHAVLRGDDVRPRRAALLKTLEAPIAAVDPVIHASAEAIVRYYQGLDEAVLGLPVALEHASFLDRLPSYAALAWHIRSIYQAVSGDGAELQACQRRMELFALREVDNDQHLRVGRVYAVAPTMLLADDLLSLERSLQFIESDAARFPGWRPWLHVARGFYHLLRGELGLARQQFDTGLAEMPGAEHCAWQHLSVGRVLVLTELGEHQAALEQARALQATVQQLQLQVREPHGVERAIALAEACAGLLEPATARLERALAQAEAQQLGHLPLGALHDARAQVALMANDFSAFEQHAQALAEHYRRLNRPGLLARHERLLQRGRSQQQSARSAYTQRPRVSTPDDPLELDLTIAVAKTQSD